MTCNHLRIDWQQVKRGDVIHFGGEECHWRWLVMSTDMKWEEDADIYDLSEREHVFGMLSLVTPYQTGWWNPGYENEVYLCGD